MHAVHRRNLLPSNASPLGGGAMPKRSVTDGDVVTAAKRSAPATSPAWTHAPLHSGKNAPHLPGHMLQVHEKLMQCFPPCVAPVHLLTWGTGVALAPQALERVLPVPVTHVSTAVPPSMMPCAMSVKKPRVSSVFTQGEPLRCLRHGTIGCDVPGGAVLLLDCESSDDKNHAVLSACQCLPNF